MSHSKNIPTKGAGRGRHDSTSKSCYNKTGETLISQRRSNRGYREGGGVPTLTTVQYSDCIPTMLSWGSVGDDDAGQNVLTVAVNVHIMQGNAYCRNKTRRWNNSRMTSICVNSISCLLLLCSLSPVGGLNLGEYNYCDFPY